MTDNYQVDPEWSERHEREKISLRDRFAIEAMACEYWLIECERASGSYRPVTFAAIARRAYRVADAMMAARNSNDDEPDLSGFKPVDDDPMGR